MLPLNGSLYVSNAGSVLVSAIVNVASKGYSGPPGSGTGRGPGAGGNYGGGGYGGNGYGSLGVAYGSASAPVDPGSSGGGAPNDGGRAGGDGGGIVIVNASGTVTINGTITADGENTPVAWAGAGSGGAVFITCNVFAGSSAGLITVRGGNSAAQTSSGCGGGGRTAIVYNPAAQAAASQPGVRFNASGGVRDTYTLGEPGTVYMPDTLIFPTQALYGCQIVIPGFNSWSTDRLTITGGKVRFPVPFQLSVTNNITCSSYGAIRISSSAGASSTVSCGGNFTHGIGMSQSYGNTTNPAVISVGGDFSLGSNGRVYLYARNQTDNYNVALTPGNRLQADGDLTVASGCIVYFDGHADDGGSHLVSARNATFDSGSTLTADSRGYRGNKGAAGDGPGAGGYTLGGGGYGGMGGRVNGGSAYGSSNAPVQPGSSGGGAPNNGGTYGGAGGGVIRIEVEQQMLVNGTMTANGGGGISWGGGGAGGSVYLRAKKFGGTTGVIRANGGAGTANGPGGGGGGGRVSIFSTYNEYVGSNPTVTGGTSIGDSGVAGTVLWGYIPAVGTVIQIR